MCIRDSTYDIYDDVDRKLAKFQSINGKLVKSYRGKWKETRLKLYKITAMPVLLYGSETWVPVKL